MCVCVCVRVLLLLCGVHTVLVEFALSCILHVCPRSSSASDYSFSKEPITGRSRTGTVTQIPQDCGAVQGTSSVKAE